MSGTSNYKNCDQAIRMRCAQAALEAVRGELGDGRPQLGAEALWLAMQMLDGPQAAAEVIGYCSVRVLDR